MKNGGQILFGLLIGLLISLWLTGSLVFAQEDRKGCQDHPLFSRMSGYRIINCQEMEFAAEDFIDPATKNRVTIEGRKVYLEYLANKPYEGAYSRLQVSRNYANALSRIGGTFYEKNPKDPSETSLKLIKDGKEVWAKLRFNYGANNLRLIILEKQAMAQQVVADFKSMAADIGTFGKVAIYGIYFDFNQAEVKAESESTLKEITKLLQQEAKLKLFVVGHTDNVGGLDYNLKLSQKRADAVVKELVLKYDLAPDRLKAFGLGPLAPAASNESEDGKAKNRRVELVKQ